MKPTDRRRGVVLGALLALSLIGFAAFDESFIHTDDGCSVELHCIACRLAIGSSVLTPVVLALPLRLGIVAKLEPRRIVFASFEDPAPTASRGPPVA